MNFIFSQNFISNFELLFIGKMDPRIRDMEGNALKLLKCGQKNAKTEVLQGQTWLVSSPKSLILGMPSLGG
jgi:predicted metalloprotease